MSQPALWAPCHLWACLSLAGGQRALELHPDSSGGPAPQPACICFGERGYTRTGPSYKGGGEGQAKGDGEPVSGKKHEFGAGVLTSRPSSGSAPGLAV